MNFPWLLLTVTCTGLWLGFVLHTSTGDHLVLGKYSYSYTLLLVLLTTFFCWLLWAAWQRRDALAGALRSLFVLAGITTIFILFVLPPAYIFLHNRSLDKDVLAPLDPQAHAFFQNDNAADMPLSLDDGTIRVLALGGSTTYGPQLERDETYPAVLEQLLQQRFPEKPVIVLNAGVPWHNSMHSLLRYVARYADWKPHIVIVLHAFNDIFQASEGRLTSGQFRSDYGHFFGALGRRVNPHDHFREMLDRILLDNWFSRTWYSDLHDNPVESDREVVDLLRSLPSFRGNMNVLVHRATQDNAQVIIASQPSLYREDMPADEQNVLFYDFYYKDYAVVPNIKEQLAAMRAFNKTSREIAVENRTWFVDLESDLPKTTEFMYDDVHYTSAGANRVARSIFEQLPWNEIISRAKIITIETASPEVLQ